MNYVGFLCVGLGIFATAFSLLCAVIGIFSKEIPIRQKAFFYAKWGVPLALCLLGFGLYTVLAKMPA